MEFNRRGMGMSTIQELIEEKRRERERIDDVIMRLEGALAVEQGQKRIGAPRKTILQMAEAVLQEAKEPLKPRDISERIEKAFGRTVKPTSLGTMLYRCAVERKKTFRKEMQPDNTYSLLKWQ
jgi:hypothetical protein